MKIETLRIEDLHPADYNPRKDLRPGDVEYEKLKSSIQEYGYVEPLIWNARTGRVISGHQRLKVLKELGESEVPCVVVDMDESHEKALNIRMNKSSGSWDDEKLEELMQDLQAEDFDISLTGFDIEDIPTPELRETDKEEGYFGDAREVTYNYYRLHEYDESRTAGYYQFPTIKAEHYVPEELIGFNYVKSYKGDRSGLGVYFFLDDYQFERMWSRPYENIERLRGFGCVLSPQFSTYRDMPMAMKIWNMYRCQMLSQMMQDAGLIVIPILHWVEEETYKFCFDGLEPGGVVAVGTMGIVSDPIACELWYSGMTESIRRLKPELVICYGPEIGYDFGDTPVKKFSSTGGFYK